MTTNLKYPVVAVEGIIGAGKSTFCEFIERRLNLYRIPEPVEENPYLDKFYADPPRWALQMQMWLVTRRCQALIKAQRGDFGQVRGILVDRSILGDRVFAEINKTEGNISEDLWPVYIDFFETMADLISPPDMIVYLNVTPSKAMNGVRTRGRASETGGVTLEYQQKLKAGYDSMIRRVADAREPWAGKTIVHEVTGYMDEDAMERTALAVDEVVFNLLRLHNAT